MKAYVPERIVSAAAWFAHTASNAKRSILENKKKGCKSRLDQLF